MKTALYKSLAANEELNRAVAELQISVANLEMHVQDLQLQLQDLQGNVTHHDIGNSTPRPVQEQDAALDAWYGNEENVRTDDQIQHPYGPPTRETDLTSIAAVWPTTIDPVGPPVALQPPGNTQHQLAVQSSAVDSQLDIPCNSVVRLHLFQQVL